LTVDALRRDALGCYGNDKGLTPFLDSLKNHSILFTKCQASGSYTQASFPGILTSSHYLEYGKTEMLSPKRTLISEPLNKAGILCGAFHSNPHMCGFFGWNRGWDMFYDSMEEDVDPKFPYVKGNIINEKLAHWLSSRPWEGGKSIFIWLHYMDIHEPYIPDRKYLDMVSPSIRLSQEEMFALFKNVLLKRDVSDPSKVDMLEKLYEAHVREIDDHIKAFFKILEDHNLEKDATIIINADHGDEFNEHGGLSHDDKMYAELIDVPLMIYNADRQQGEICDRLVSNLDIPPTILHVFSLGPPEAFEGRSLLPLDSYEEKGCFGEALDQRSKKGGDINKDIYYYREKDLKIIYRADLDSWEMYDLKTDPGELDNIVEKSPDAQRLKGRLKPRVKRWS
jgi:arylsulfatase A-like enzyme